jgi:hypothetical protein
MAEKEYTDGLNTWVNLPPQPPCTPIPIERWRRQEKDPQGAPYGSFEDELNDQLESQNLERKGRQLIRLSQHRGARLLQDIEPSEIRRLLSDIHISNPTFRRLKILLRDAELGHGGRQP